MLPLLIAARMPDLRRALVAWWGEKPLAQAILFLAVIGMFTLFGHNLSDNMQRLGLTPGFAFLGHAANFEIGEAPISYAAGDTYARAILVGVLNTIEVALAGCVLATILGVALGVARLSSNPLLSGLVQVYVEVVRNTPLLLQIFFWNTLSHALPGPRAALSPLPGVLLSNRGVFLPLLACDAVSLGVLGCAIAAAALTALALRGKARRKARLSLKQALGLPCVAFAAPLLIAEAFGLGPSLDWPRLSGFNIRGGASLSPEFMAILVALVVNAAGSIAEIVRAGILSVPHGQWDAARALGLGPTRIMRLVVLPQALRVIVPVLTSSYVSLTKNSSLAVAIGFPDLVSILNTTANTTGQALEAIAIMMAVYLALSLGASAAMNLYNARWNRIASR